MTDATTMQTEVLAESGAESGRARVRRLLIDPLSADGMRFPKATPEAERQAELNALADRLGYMSDDGLVALRACMRSKGAGSTRDFWPSLASFTGFAEAFEPRPLKELPELLRWFASRAGADAAARGEAALVAEYLFWQAKKRPPLNDRDREAVASRAAEMAREAELVRDRQRRGVPPRGDELSWLAWFEDLHARVSGYLRDGGAA